MKDGRESVTDVKFAPRHLGLQFATCSADGFVRIFCAEDVMNFEHWACDKFQAGSDKEEVTCLSWNPSRFDPAMLVVGGPSHTIKIWSKCADVRKWQVIAQLMGHNGAVNDVTWAPNLGRSYHLIASASSDTKIKIWKLRKGENDEFDVSCAATLNQKTEVWRCEWNVTGTVLATSGDDGTVRLWRMNFKSQWTCVTEISGTEEQQSLTDVTPTTFGTGSSNGSATATSSN